MRVDMRRFLRLPGPDPKHDLEPNRSNLTASPQTIPLRYNAFRASVMYLLTSAIACAGEIYLAMQSRAWQLFVIAGCGVILTGVAALSVSLVRRGRPRLGVRLLIAASLISVLVAPLLIASFGLILGFGTILVVLTLALQTLPQKEANLALLASVGVAVVAGGLDLLSPASQLTLPTFHIFIAVLGGVMIVVYGAVMIHQFRIYPLTTKLILAFLIVSLLPLGLLAFLNDRYTRSVLTQQAQQSLFTAASKTATDIDTFITDNLEAVRIEAQLPGLVTYLSLPAEQRRGSAEEAAAAATLRELSRKDKVFIVSYALLDSQGQNVIDTYAPYIGRDESSYDYFQKPLETGLPYLSPVEFMAPIGEENSAPPAEAALFFSSPIRDNLTTEVLGVLRIHYQTIILQKLVVQNNNLVGEQSFAVLFDENYIRLAHGTAPKLIFQPAAPLKPEQLAQLKAASRLPDQLSIEPSANLPALVTGLENAIFEPYFTTRLEPASSSLTLAAVKELETQPWLVVFVQPQDRFLAPIQAQTKVTLFVAITIAGVVAAAAFAMGQLLANPLVQLTEVVTRFTTGDLEARAPLRSGDETGVLAASFNRMAGTVGHLLKNLAERTVELEAEISERQRAEADLQASEEKYRSLFEDSRDVIFITSPAGQIVDISPASLSLFGYSRAELLTMKAHDLYVDPADRLKFEQEIERQGAVRDFEINYLRKDGQVRDCLVTATVRRTAEGAILSYQGIIRDITEQKRVEKERLRLSAIERELTLAQEIQHSLLPPAHPDWNGPDVVCYSIPAREMGGDLYAYHVLAPAESSEAAATIKDNCHYAVAVGDVSGKGMPAALLMAVSLASFQAVVRQGLPPRALLAHLDQAIAPYTRTTGQNCALVYLEITLPPPASASSQLDENKGGRLRVANAGCVTPLIRPAQGPVAWVDIYGTPLGIGLSSESGYLEAEIPLSPGDMIILTSDGVVEANNAAGAMFGFDRLEQAVISGPATSAEAMLDHLKAEVAAFVGQTEPHDDLTIVVVQV